LQDQVGAFTLKQPVQIWIENVELPPEGRCVLKGYESGRWIGIPWEVEQATGFEFQALWQFQFYFLATSFEHRNAAFEFGVQDQDKKALEALCGRAVDGNPAGGTCPNCSAKLQISRTSKGSEVKCPSGCFYSIGNFGRNSGIVIRGRPGAGKP
jgi:hypothetical protein